LCVTRRCIIDHLRDLDTVQAIGTSIGKGELRNFQFLERIAAIRFLRAY